MDLGAVVLGLLNGSTIGLLAVGFVLVYKSNKFLNLAHAQLGAVASLLLAKTVLDWGWSWWISFLLAVVVGGGTGVAVERTLIGRVRRQGGSPTRLLLLSLAVSQLLLALTFIPSFSPDTADGATYPQPFNATVEVAGIFLSGMEVLTAFLVPALVIALAAFMKYSVLGKQIRAAAANPEYARLCGISVDRVSAVTWSVAGAFSAISAVLQGPTQPLFNVGVLGPNLLMLTLGAAAFGAFTSLPLALAGGLALGLVYQLVADATSSGTNAQLAVFGAILLVVLLRGSAIAKVFDVSGAAVEDRPPLRIPVILRSRAFVRHMPLWVSGAALGTGLVLPHLPYFSSSGNRFLLSIVLVYAVVGVSLTIVLGWSGQVSLGHFAVVGVGAYLTARWSPGLSFAAMVLGAGLIGAMTMVLVGLPALRIRGLALAVTTLGFAVVASEWLYLQPWLGTDNPFGVIVEAVPLGLGLGTAVSELQVYNLALALLVLAVGSSVALRRSTPGRLIVAVRDNERASASFGVAPATVKLATLGVSGALCGAAGVVWAASWDSVTPTQFLPTVSLAVLALPVIGGLGSVGGAVLAAVLLYGTTFFVGPSLDGVFGDTNQSLGLGLLLSGVGSLVVLVRYPHGLAGAVQRHWQGFLDRQAQHQEDIVRDVDDELPLVVRGVRLAFGGIQALDGPDIEVRAGEIVGLIGTNGAGKTTLMNVISGVHRPDDGSVRVFGREVVHLAPDFRPTFGLARSFQDASLFAGLTVRETIQVAVSRTNKVGFLSAMTAAPWARMSDRRSRRIADEIVERFGLDPWADVHTASLSTGSRRICDLAAQVASRPRVLLLDEPTAGVAQREAERFGPLLREIREELDCSVLIIEHDMPLLMGLCDRVYALEGGRVIAEGTPEEIREHPRVVASYLGSEEVAISRSGSSNRRPRPRRTPLRAEPVGAGE